MFKRNLEENSRNLHPTPFEGRALLEGAFLEFQNDNTYTPWQLDIIRTIMGM